MINLLLFLNGMLFVIVFAVVCSAVYALWRVKQGCETLAEISKVHNVLVESVAKIDEKAQTALLTLDHIKLKNPI